MHFRFVFSPWKKDGVNQDIVTCEYSGVQKQQVDTAIMPTEPAGTISLHPPHLHFTRKLWKCIDKLWLLLLSDYSVKICVELWRS